MKLIIDIPEEIYIEKKEDYIGDTLDKAIANGTPLSEELEKIKEKIDFEEKWLIGIKMDNGFISIADIQIAMSGIRSVISELKGESNEIDN